MKKIISILFLVISFQSYGQNLPPTPGTTTRSTPSAFVEDYNVSFRQNAIIPRYIDSSQANLLPFSRLDTAGRIIYTTSDNKFWIRKNSPKRWVEIGGSGGLSGGNLGLGYRLYYPPSQGIKTVFGGYGMLIDSSSNSNGLTFRPDTSVLFPAIRSTIPSQINYTASNGLSLVGSDFRLGGTLSQNTTINSNGFLFGITNLPTGDTASYDLTINSLGQLIERPIGQSNVFLSQALTSTPTAGGADSLHFTKEINPWPTYTFYGRLSGDLGTQNLNLQNTLDGGGAFNKRNVLEANGFKLAIDSGSLVINAKYNTDTVLYLKRGEVMVRGNGFTTFHNTAFQVGSLGAYVKAGKFMQFDGNSTINVFQQSLLIKRQYANVEPFIGVKIYNDTSTSGGLIDSNLYKILSGAFTSRQTGIESEKFYFTARGYAWFKEMPYSATVDTLVGWKNGILTATLSSQFAGSGGGGLSGGNLGSAFRLYYPPSQGIKTVFSSYGIAIDSSTSNQINFRVDTNLLSTRLWRDKLKDSLVSLIGTKQNTITESDDNLTFTSNILGTNTAFQALTDGATITFTTANGINGRVTLGGNRTLSIPSPQNGKIYAIKVFQGTGGNTLALPGGASAVLRTGAGDSTLITGQYDGTNGSWMWYSDYSTAALPSVITVTTSTTLASPVDGGTTVLTNASGGAVTHTLPSASSNTGRIYRLKKMDSSGNAMNVTTVEGAQSITTQYAGLMIQSTGSAWAIIGIF